MTGAAARGVGLKHSPLARLARDQSRRSGRYSALNVWLIGSSCPAASGVLASCVAVVILLSRSMATFMYQEKASQEGTAAVSACSLRLRASEHGCRLSSNVSRVYPSVPRSRTRHRRARSTRTGAAAACAAAPLPQPSAGSEPLGSIERIRATNLSSSRWRAAAAALPPT